MDAHRAAQEQRAQRPPRRLVDEHHVVVHPVVLGGGKPLFAPGTPRLGLELVGSTPCDGRTVVLRYRPSR